MYALKKIIRAVTFYKRNKLTNEQLKENSRIIQDMLMVQHHWKKAKSVNIYESIFKEVSTHELIHIANQSKEVYYPEEDIEENHNVDLIIIPGVVFDEKCGRCGRGSGYYDKYLDRIKALNVTTIALAHDLQILPHDYELNNDKWDVSMDMIITEKRIITQEGIVWPHDDFL
jgi:5-formyltetrahydrofolate cyclo-ligase